MLNKKIDIINFVFVNCYHIYHDISIYQYFLATLPKVVYYLLVIIITHLALCSLLLRFVVLLLLLSPFENWHSE